MLDIGDIEQGCAEHALVVLQVVRRILDEQPVARLQNDRWQLRKKQRVTALNLVDAQSVGLRQDLGQCLAVGRTAFLNMQLRAEYAR